MWKLLRLPFSPWRNDVVKPLVKWGLQEYILPGPLLLLNTAVYCACYILTDIDAVIYLNNVDLKTDGLQGNSYLFLSIQ